ncbi:RluA family pseudouridine synthase [Piscibacillus salipiscarius]|uniref:RluA family pseudouridine synthase n=1 Tax=Piscibacillus salipiscarius TaxID=299480 RepID=UPI0006CF556A|nr:RluA family pseudouridine synthase [Piscibacillus salipiscarius]
MMLKWKITSSDEHKLVRDYLLHDRAFSNRLLKELKKSGKILVEGEPVTVRHSLRSGQILTVHMPIESVNENLKPIEMNLNIVYEDDFLLTINKPRGLSVLPNMNDEVTLANGLVDYYLQNHIKSTVHIVTRIDKWTSGLVLIAKNKYIHYLLSKQNIHREYRAIIEGKIQKEIGTIDLPIARNLPSIIERKVDVNGKRATTHFQVLKEMNDRSLIAVTLDTGRTHQIRVHFSYMGHPLIGG